MAEALLIPQFEQDLSDYALKSYVDNAVANKDVGVTTFNGRKGAVSPQSGDYTYSMVGAASSGHNHSGTYSESGHTHNYAASNHTHSYAASNHTHDYAASNHTHTVTGSSHTHSDYASSTHSHSNYASSSHTHSYASTNHSHSDYASSSHTHSGYASSTHTHSYASTSHTHSGYASSSHTHSAGDITGKGGIFTKVTPSDTAPANGYLFQPNASGGSGFASLYLAKAGVQFNSVNSFFGTGWFLTFE